MTVFLQTPLEGYLGVQHGGDSELSGDGAVRDCLLRLWCQSHCGSNRLRGETCQVLGLSRNDGPKKKPKWKELRCSSGVK